MKVIIDKEISIENIHFAHDQLDLMEYFDNRGIKYSPSWSFWVILEEQEIELSPVHTEDFLDVLAEYCDKVVLERAERGIYFLRTY